MAFVLTTPERTGEDLMRILREEVQGAVTELGEANRSPDAVHAARKHLKKARAVLRLARGPLGEARGPANETLREAGRRLSPLRDHDAMLEALDKAAPDLGPERAQVLWAELERRREAARSAQDPDTLPETRMGLERLRGEMESWELPGAGFAPLEEGLEATYGWGRAAWLGLGEDPGPEALHGWRKRVKDHWYHIRLVVHAWPALLGAREAALDGLSDLLGDDHDLAVLRGVLLEVPDRRGDAAAVDRLLAERQEGLRREARALGRRVYAEKPKPFRKRMAGYWEAWRQDDSPRTA
ncbi:MAG TPA: CHAD domain-containing protein [Gammaproteobacteria bacterium]|nr:CHAD domain-containing protein [Gammaproteobacteria bacterium]